MRISKKGEYALRAMINLASNYNKSEVRIDEISKKEGIPKKFLELILLELKKNGLLKSKRGIGGGYSLIKAPDEITLAQIIRVIDGPLAPSSCVSKWAHISCPNEKTCGLRSVMLEVRNAIARILEKTTLDDVIKRTKNSARKGESRSKISRKN